jgi:hypothetical protein
MKAEIYQLPNLEDPYQYNIGMEQERTGMIARMRCLEKMVETLEAEVKLLRKEVETQLISEGGMFFDDLRNGVRFVRRAGLQKGE